MEIVQHSSLKNHHTFGIHVSAAVLAHIDQPEELAELAVMKSLPPIALVLGGGSNILFTRPVNGTVIHNRIKGISILRENEQYVWVRAMAGVVWHDLVKFALSHNLGGIENLALIPGYVGAAPVQNIGAYGAEAKDTIESVVCWHLEEKNFFTLNVAACRLGYRDSIFKQELKGKTIITSVDFRMDKYPRPNTAYGAIRQELEKAGVDKPTIQTVAAAVIAIRRSKLPDPTVINNAGSFFKNPVITTAQLAIIHKDYPEMPFYPADEQMVKIPAGWLTEQAGWKGYRKGDAGVHPHQALVLVNYGHALGTEILALSDTIMQSVQSRFGILLEREVQIW